MKQIRSYFFSLILCAQFQGCPDEMPENKLDLVYKNIPPVVENSEPIGRAILELAQRIRLREGGQGMIGVIYARPSRVSQQNLYLVDRTSSNIKVYNSQGEYLLKMGRYGQGPGEFERVMGIAFDDSTLYANDDRARRISLFDLQTGEYLHSFRTPGEYDADPGDLALFDGQFYSNAWPADQKPDLPNSELRPLVVFDCNGILARRFGRPHEIYNRLKTHTYGNMFDLDEQGNVYFSQSLHFSISKFKNDGRIEHRFGHQGRFRVPDYSLQGRESIAKLQDLGLTHSWGSTLHYVPPGYLVFVYTDLSREFFQSKDPSDKMHHLQVYTTDGEYLQSDLPLPGGGIIDVDEEGFIYVWENTDVEKQEIGKYRLLVEGLGL